MDRAVIMGHYPQTRMALVKHGETEISPSMVLCAHFVQDWLSAGSHLGANRLLLYRRAPITGQELRLAARSAH